MTGVGEVDRAGVAWEGRSYANLDPEEREAVQAWMHRTLDEELARRGPDLWANVRPNDLRIPVSRPTGLQPGDRVRYVGGDVMAGYRQGQLGTVRAAPRRYAAGGGTVLLRVFWDEPVSGERDDVLEPADVEVSS